MEHIYRFTELQSLEIRLRYPLLHQFLHKLRQLPHLLDLIIDTDDFAPSIQPHTTPISISNSKFTQLRHLQILGTTGSIRCILNVLKGLTNLSALKIDRESDTVTPWGFQVQVQDISEIWKPFFEVISTFSAVEDIEIFDRSQESISASSLAPLFRLDNLKSFVINDIILSGSDDDFHLLAGGFPKLKKFVIPRPLLSDRRTLVCLYFLSRDCPDLRGVAITLLSNISENLNAIKELPHPIVRNHHPLEKLYIDSDFGQLQPIQLVQVARFLDLIFPNLSTLETDKSKSTEAANWAGIHELRSALREARMNPSSVGDIWDYQWLGAKLFVERLLNYMITVKYVLQTAILSLPCERRTGELFFDSDIMAPGERCPSTRLTIVSAQHRKPLEIVWFCDPSSSDPSLSARSWGIELYDEGN